MKGSEKGEVGRELYELMETWGAESMIDSNKRREEEREAREGRMYCSNEDVGVK